MDNSKRPLGVIGMVFGDYAMLQRWFDYYAAQVGAENLYLFSHGNDPQHHAIAKGAHVIGVPRDRDVIKFDARRWRMMSHFASGYLNYYNWMLVTDIDEIFAVDPEVSPSLVEYLESKFSDISTAPTSISPLGLNIVHVPEEEPLPIVSDQTILSRRRYFYPSRVYSKPTLVRAPVIFGPGGHRNNLGPRTLSDDLYLIHLKFCDFTDIVTRTQNKNGFMDDMVIGGAVDVDKVRREKTLASYQELRNQFILAEENIKLPEFREKMKKQRPKYVNNYIWGNAKSNKLYQIPSRFSSLV
ncbi:glycosyltransferase family 2 protein [uncultured Roseobacter sp.]|uniref:glycosyltransferase family 2 protein n=1 Tax=uncultured Roseobacter sp. TaxID=114847 RepID=UPI0026228465|nr:glycosyltransferase family 2 protein [uncultured Roseobacter sp.]